jgi:hypothetical protein
MLSARACSKRAGLSFQDARATTDGNGYSSLRSNFLCGLQICKPCRSIT